VLDAFLFSPVKDVSSALWLLPYLHPSSASPSLGNLLPPFDDYARIFHPAREYIAHNQSTHATFLTWAEVANRNHKVMHRQAQWPRIASNFHNLDERGFIREQRSQHWLEPPVSGSLPVEVADILVTYLGGISFIEPCFFALWEGFHCLPAQHTVKFGSHERRFFLFSGRLGQLRQSWCATYFQSANLCWPSDQSWCIMTEIDAMSTYIGGPQTLIDSILSSSLEAVRVAASDKVFIDSVNLLESS
jgi:hypothetical protein